MRTGQEGRGLNGDNVVQKKSLAFLGGSDNTKVHKSFIKHSMIWYIEQSKENVDTTYRISQTDEAKGTFGETFRPSDRGEDQ